MAMDLRPMPFAEWIWPGETQAADLAEKAHLIATRPDEVFASLPQSEAAQAELLATLLAHLRDHLPEHYSVEPDRVVVKAADRTIPLATDEPPLQTAGRMVQEDFCLLQSDGAENDAPYRLTAASLCFPTRWRLSEKIGHPLAAIHGPVPGYEAQIAAHVDRFFQVLKTDRPVQRANWSIVDDPALFQPTGHGRSEARHNVSAKALCDRLWFRTERQTLLRLTKTGAVVFGIRINQLPLSAIANDPGKAPRLLHAIQSMPPETARYKSLLPYQSEILQILAKFSDIG